MAVNLSPVGGAAAQFFDNSGNVLTGGKLYTYLASTTTPQPAYTTNLGNIAWSNPIILDAAGRVSGSGEIWLTDSIQYKFILRDSNDVLIATYDNLIGINSNFVAFTNQQEIQTATAGQTVFNLTTMQYQPGTNSLTVFVDGVNQYGPGAQYAYVETDADTVTFVNGLHVGAQVKFTTSQLNSSGASVDAQQVSYTPPFTGSVPTNVENKLSQYVSVKDFGAAGDGLSDDTVAIQTALNNSVGRSIYVPKGTYIVTSLTGVSNVEIVGENQESTIFKRKNADAGTSPMFNYNNASDIKISNCTFDGNKGSQSNTQAIFNFNACDTIVIDSCTIKNAYTNNGINLTDGTGDTNEEQIVIKNCTIKDCDVDAIYISKTFYIVIDKNLLKNNGSSGVVAINFVFPPVQEIQNYIQVTNNTMIGNGQCGVSFVGAYVGGSPGAPIPGTSVPPQKGVIISGNTCISNDQYGIAFQGYGGVIDGNYCEKNGASAAYGGINAGLSEATLVTNNVCHDNYAWGIDVGGSINCLCNSNVVTYTGLTSGSPSVVGINFGGSVLSQCVGNTLSYNGGAGCSSIYVSGIEFGTGYLEVIGANVTVADNTITLLTNTAFGIYINNGTNNVSLNNNQVYSAGAGNAFKLEGGASSFDMVNKSNIDWSNGGVLPSVASASTLVIPDNGETFQITGTTNINTIYTKSADIYKSAVRFVQITNQGSGYNPASPPSVTFAPPGSGTTATGTAAVSNGGKVIGVVITNAGSGYSPSSPPAVTFGSGVAAGTAIVGCNNYQSRIVTFLFNDILTITSGSNISLATANFTTRAGSTMTFMGSFGNWYEVSRKF
jgi:hypothetical protein